MIVSKDEMQYETDKSLVYIFDENGTILFGFFE